MLATTISHRHVRRLPDHAYPLLAGSDDATDCEPDPADIVRYWPDAKPRLAGFDMLGEYGPPDVPDIGDFYDLEPADD